MTQNIKLLLDDYAGPVSEMTAITQYLHHHWVTDNPEVADLLDRISLVEMTHQDRLAVAMWARGVDPRYWSASGVYWMASYVDYQYNVCDILRADINAELAAIVQYQRHIREIPDPEITELLQSIVVDETQHVRMFLDAYSRYCPGMKPETILESWIPSFKAVDAEDQLKALMK